MKKLLALVVVVLAVGAALGALALRSHGLTPTGGQGPGVTTLRTLEKAPWEAYHYQLRQGPTARSYNLPAVVRALSPTDANVRLLLDLQDPDNYYFVEVTSALTRIGKVESGLEAALGTQRPVGLRVPEANRIVVKRRYDSIEVVLNDTVVARAEDESFHGGRLGAGVLADSATVKLGTLQRCDPVYVADDFMKTAPESQGWATVTGSWEVATLRNPSLSSNAFYYVGGAVGGSPPAAAVRGEWFWDNYRFRAAIASDGAADVGIYFYYRDADNYYLFRWNAESQPDGKKGRRQLIRRWHGKDTVVAEAPGGYQPRVWYLLEAEAVGPRIRTFIDGHPIFSLADENLCFGQVGLHSANAMPVVARFDDILVQTVRSFEEDFTSVAAGRWQPLGGTWEQREESGRHYCRVAADGPAKAVAGSGRWRDYTAAATVRLPKALVPLSEVGVVGHYLDEANYALFAWRPATGAGRLEAFVDGQRVAAEKAALPSAPAATAHLLELDWKGTILTARLDGQVVASAWVPTLPRGKAGLYAAEVDNLTIENVKVDFPLPPEPVLTTHEVFSREHTMDIWAGAANDWEATRETLNGQPIQPWWHRADFFGDTTIEVELKGDAAQAAAAGQAPRACRLVLSATSKDSVLSGYNFVFAWPGSADPKAACKATITRGKDTVAEGDVPLDDPVQRLRFQRLGSHVVASVNEKAVLAARDREPLTGLRAAVATTNLPVHRDDVAVFSDNVEIYTFSRASTDWRPAGGLWTISNRWECDPRWSFFSGTPEGSPLAAIWNKRGFEGDVSVEFAVGPKMDSSRGGGNYRYARDFNVTLGADGSDINSGYTFLFGGWDDTATAIVRHNKVVARSSYVIPRDSNIHRRWFYVKAEKRGSVLNYWIDGTRILTYTDPDPLPGNRIALWSWDCGIMVSRVRIGAAAVRPAEPPGTASGPCRTVYSQGN